MLIIGTLRTEIEDNILYYSAEEYFKKFREYFKEQGKTPSEVDAQINSYIKQVNLQTQVSQSIGRNSGFRDKGKKAVVVLPLLQPNSTKKFKPINLNYISSDVRVLYQPDIDSEESEGSDDTSEASTESTKLTL